MAIRKIDAPGIELNEVDKSLYDNMPDYSIVDTTALVCGFADKGENYTIQWINTALTLVDRFGYPTNEAETFFYNAGLEIINSGGILLAAKLPYDNNSKDKYTYCDYKFDVNNLHNTSVDYNIVTLFDPTISSYISILLSTTNGYMTIELLDNIKTGYTKLLLNSFRIVDITRSQYEKVNIIDKVTVEGNVESIQYEDECLGVFPVVVTPMNALFFLKLLSCDTKVIKMDYNTSDLDSDVKKELEDMLNNSPMTIESTDYIDKFNIVSDFRTIGATKAKNYIEDNYTVLLSSTSINDNTVSRLAADTFPLLTITDRQLVDTTYLKQIGIVVFKMYKDSANSDKINFALVEAFVGSPFKSEKDLITNKSIFIDDIVNANSQYINLFSNVKEDNSNLKQASTFLVNNLTATSLSFHESDCVKNISFSTSILLPLTLIFELAQDKNTYNIDLVIDAGVSNLALLAYLNKKYVEELTLNSNTDTNAWRTVIAKYDTFCKNMRKDCMCIVDGHRGFCLDKQLKIVRRTAPNNSVSKNILPKLKYMTVLNSSYAAGYCNWFLTRDAYTNDTFWCPPSIKAASVYIYTDIYYNKWDAPAGLNRGTVKNVYDCAFSPLLVDAGKIYNQQWNYAVNYPLYGIVIEGQKTFQVKKTAFDRVNVRRLFLSLEKQVSNIAKYFVYEGNTAYLRQRFVDQIRPILENAVSRSGIVEYYIKCDETNNTPNTIDNNELHCAIAIKPVKTIEFIILNFTCTNQSANVEETLA